MKRINHTYILLLVLFSSIACGVMTPVPSALSTEAATVSTETGVNTAAHVIITPTARPVYLVVGDWNIRDGATEASTKRGELLDGQTVTIRFCRFDGWCRLDNGYYLCGRAVGLAEVCK